MEDDLDWLARNVHVWPEGKCEVLVRYPRNAERLIWSSVSSDVGWITKAQWLARRAELQNKPSWDDAPEWGEWLAQDEDGEWKWLAGLPGKYVDGWTAVKIKGHCKGLALGDWRDTLERRPEQQEEFQPFISIEDNQEQAMAHHEEIKQQDNSWFERGELPPVGVKCEVLWGDGEWYMTNVLAHLHIDSSNICPVFTTEWDDEVYVACMPCYKFRPIRTERQLTVDEMMAVAAANFGNLETCCEALYDAGYRKQISPAK